MPDTVSPILTEWSNFYAMTATAAAGLTGLMFVVITLVTGADRRRSRVGTSTFSTPTVVHFCAAFLVSAVLVAPWHSLAGPAALVGLAGLCGLAYALHVLRRTKRLTEYTPDFEDWAWYSLLPIVAYATILGGAVALRPVPLEAPFAFATGVVLLIFIGIHNAWDIVTYLAVSRGNDEEPPSPS